MTATHSRAAGAGATEGAAPPAIEVTDLTVKYGARLAVDRLSFTVPTGSIYGFLGPNGAGKTTTIKTLLGFRRPGGGRARVLGLDITRHGTELRARVGYVSEVDGLYDHLTAEQTAGFFRSTAGRWDQGVFDRFVNTFGVPRRARVGGLSRGTRMQLAFALAMGGDPELLILDEPTSGLDPVARRELLGTLVAEVATSGKTVFFSSHNLAEVEAVADQVGILRAGRLLLSGDLDDLKQRHKVLRITFDSAPTPGETAALRALGGVARLEQEGRHVRLSLHTEVEDVLRAAHRQGVRLHPFDVVDRNLEDLFLDLMKEDRG